MEEEAERRKRGTLPQQEMVKEAKVLVIVEARREGRTESRAYNQGKGDEKTW